jgi:23S rRNA pseudouridine1911/1915/1917 synthase
MPNPPSYFAFRVGRTQAGNRLDTLVAAEVDHCSRSFAAALIRQGHITVDGAAKKAGYPVKAGETVSGQIPLSAATDLMPEAIPLEILFEDSELLAINKEAGRVVHPAPGHPTGTLANALMHHCPDLTGISGCQRPGIVHRLDKDTTGVLVVAKNDRCMQHLAAQFKSREVRKQYLALVYGVPGRQCGTIDLPVGRHPQDRKKMSVHTHTPRLALTHWRVRETYAGACLLELDIRTGRTHQIRVHCQSMGHPLIGDPVYGNRAARNQLLSNFPDTAGAAKTIDRQMLHAWRLRIHHPVSGEPLALEAPLPPDMAGLIERLRKISGMQITAK